MRECLIGMPSRLGDRLATQSIAIPDFKSEDSKPPIKHQSARWASQVSLGRNRRSDPQPLARCLRTLTVFANLACSPNPKGEWLGEGCRPRTTTKPRISGTPLMGHTQRPPDLMAD